MDFFETSAFSNYNIKEVGSLIAGFVIVHHFYTCLQFTFITFGIKATLSIIFII